MGNISLRLENCVLDFDSTIDDFYPVGGRFNTRFKAYKGYKFLGVTIIDTDTGQEFDYYRATTLGNYLNLMVNKIPSGELLINVFTAPIGVNDNEEIYLISSGAENNRVTKFDYFKDSYVIKGNFNTEFDIDAPVLNLQNFDNNHIENFNYLYIPSLNRFYFIEGLTSLADNIWEISLNIDVLMSFRYSISRTRGFIDKNEFTYNNDIIDKNRVIVQGQDIEEKTVFNNLIDVYLDDAPYSAISFVLSGFNLSTRSVK